MCVCFFFFFVVDLSLLILFRLLLKVQLRIGFLARILPIWNMEEQFILRVPPEVAERIDKLLSENASSSGDVPLDLSFSGRVKNKVQFHISNLFVASCCFVFSKHTETLRKVATFTR